MFSLERHHSFISLRRQTISFQYNCMEAKWQNKFPCLLLRNCIKRKDSGISYRYRISTWYWILPDATHFHETKILHRASYLLCKESRILKICRFWTSYWLAYDLRPGKSTIVSIHEYWCPISCRANIIERWFELLLADFHIRTCCWILTHIHASCLTKEVCCFDSLKFDQELPFMVFR